MSALNLIILSKKVKDDVFSFKMFFLVCLAGTSSLISWGISASIFEFSKNVGEVSTIFILISILASIVIFAPVTGIFFGADVFTESGRGLVFGCISRKAYLLSRWMAASLLVVAGVLLTITIPVFVSYTRFQGINLDTSFLLAIVSFILFSFLFVSVSTFFSVAANSTMGSVVLSGVYTTLEFGVGLAGYVFGNEILYYFSPHALLIRGVLPEHEQTIIQLSSIIILLLYCMVFLWLAIYYSKRRNV